MNKNTFSEGLLSRQYKDHTVPNPVDSLRLEDLPTSAFSVHNQPIRELSVTMQVIDEVTGRTLETLNGLAVGGSVKVDSTSMIRRTASVELVVTQDTFPQPDSLMWFNRYIKMYVGINDNTTKDDVVNFLVGTFWIDDSSYEISETTHSVKFNLGDKMTKWDDIQLENPLTIPRETPIDVAIRMLMEDIGETEFGEMVSGRPGEVVPYTIEYSIGDNVLDLIQELRDMYMEYICGYSVDGKFEFQRVELQQRALLREPKWRFDTTNDNLKTQISFAEEYNLKNIKNRVLVYGGTSDVTGLTPVGESRLTDSKSPFNSNVIGKKTKVIVEDRYVTNEQCLALAKYELFKLSNFKEMASLSAVPIYFLDAHDIIEVVHPFTNKEHEYVIDTINFGLDIDAAMTITAHKLYYVTVEYGEEDMPIVDYIERGVKNYGWIRLAEEAIAIAFNMMGTGNAALNISFENNIAGSEQARVQAYPTTKNQSMVFDLADMQYLDINSSLGTYVPGANKSTGDNLTRLILHEMYHAVVNDYLGYSKAIQVPTYFAEGMSELIHGARERFESTMVHLSNSAKKTQLIELCDWLLGNNFSGSSDDYTASFLIAWAIYRILKRQGQWVNMMTRLRAESNLSLNFLIKLIPAATSEADARAMIMQEIRTMDSVWNGLFSSTVKDTGSVLGSLGENYYGMELTKDNVINPDNFNDEASIGFDIKIIR